MTPTFSITLYDDGSVGVSGMDSQAVADWCQKHKLDLSVSLKSSPESAVGPYSFHIEQPEPAADTPHVVG